MSTGISAPLLNTLYEVCEEAELVIDDNFDPRYIPGKLAGRDYIDNEELEERQELIKAFLEDHKIKIPEDSTAPSIDWDLFKDTSMENDIEAAIIEYRTNLAVLEGVGHFNLLIHEDSFKDYAREYYVDIGEIRVCSLLEPYIDWEGVVNDMLQDYDEVDYMGYLYYYR